MRRKPTSPPARAIASSLLSRRAFLRSAGAFGGAALLAGCGMQDPDAAAPSAATDRSGQEKVVRWANWELYLDYDEEQKVYPTLQAFQEETGIKAEYSEDIEDNDSYYGKIRSKLTRGEDIGKDLVVFTDPFAARMIREGYAQELDRDKIPNSRNIRGGLVDVDFDPRRAYSLTWQSGFTGLAWSTEHVPAGLRTIQDLWAPALHGHVEVLTEMRDTIALIMLDAGVDVSSEHWGDNEFFQALDEFQRWLATGHIRQTRGQSYVDDLRSGDAWAVIAWSGDIIQLQLDEPDRWGFAIPEKGGTLWSDNMLIPIGSPHKANAEKLMNHYYDPAVAAEVAAYVNYISPVEGAREAMEKIDPSLVDNRLVFPTAEDLEKVKQFRTLTLEDEVRYATEFQKVLGN
jgi:spermidine/putrescine transport system substrate-binding protein